MIRLPVEFLSKAPLTNLRKAPIGLVMSVLLRGKNRSAVDEFLRNLIFQDFSKICQEN
jgi:hypothetical protein